MQTSTDTSTSSERSGAPSYDPARHEAHLAAVEIFNTVSEMHITESGELRPEAFDMIMDRVHLATKDSRRPLIGRLKNARDDAAENRDRAARHDDHEEKRWRDGEVEAYAKVLSWLSDAE